MTVKEDLERINKEIKKEVQEMNDWHRLLKHKKQRLYKLFAEQSRLWKKLIGQAKHEKN